MRSYIIICQFHDLSTSSDFMKAVHHLDSNVQHPIDNIWYVQSHHSIDFIQQKLLSLIDLDDVLIVSEINDQRFYNANMPKYATSKAAHTSKYQLFS